MKFFIFFCMNFIVVSGSVMAQTQAERVPRVDKIVIIMQEPAGGIASVKTIVRDFTDPPTNVQECKSLAEEYDDFTKLDGIVLCYYQGKRLVKYKL